MEHPSDSVVEVEALTDQDVRLKVRGNRRFLGVWSGNVNVELVMETPVGNYVRPSAS